MERWRNGGRMKVGGLLLPVLILSFASVSFAQELKKEFIEPQAQESRSTAVKVKGGTMLFLAGHTASQPRPDVDLGNFGAQFKATFEKICEAFRPAVAECVAVYGADNHLRLTGKHETASINDYSYGVSDRGASIRIPLYTVQKGWSGYLEDRRPNSAADPYKVAARIIKTVKSAI